MHILVRHLPPESATARATLGEGAAWGIAEQLLAMVVDVLRAGNWQRGGGKGERPRPLPRPGLDGNVRRIRGRSSTPEQLKARLKARWTPQEGEGEVTVDGG